ncbi:MAG: hypothetical protein MUE66_10735 [Acidimicrobiia bacterium]|nr:hypothetical protein [Acidimicrobiia bacterium]
MKSRTVVFAIVAVLAVALAACGDDSAFNDDTFGTLDPSAPGVTGTVPIPGPIDGLEWSPVESPDATTEAELVAGLEELGFVLVVPDSPSPTGEATRALLNSMSMGWGSGATFAGSTDVTLNVMVGNDTIVLIRTFKGTADCYTGYTTAVFRGDQQACSGEGGVQWQESGQAFEASFSGSLTLEQGIAWLETWRLVP